MSYKRLLLLSVKFVQLIAGGVMMLGGGGGVVTQLNEFNS